MCYVGVCWMFSVSFVNVFVFLFLNLLILRENKKVFKRGRMKTF